MRGNSHARLLFAIAVLVPLVAVVAIVGSSHVTPPRLVTAGGDDFFTHLHTEKAMANVITVELETPDERPLAANAVSVTLSKPDAGVEPATAQAQRTDDGRWRAAMTAPVAGRWTLRLGIQAPDSDAISVEAPILIK
jgi:copper transport protein